tara:strand:- start:350 stop:679 length:330 start_codon:yes stop_codon:yes gene_type:complete
MSWEGILKIDSYDEMPFDEISEKFRALVNDLDTAVVNYEDRISDIQSAAEKMQDLMDIPELQDNWWMAMNNIIEEKTFNAKEVSERLYKHIREIERLLKEREDKLLEGD